MNERTLPESTLSTEERTYRQRLLNVVTALRESPAPDAFDMRWFTHSGFNTTFPCGTPMCALGHYAARRDLQTAFRIHGNGAMTVEDKDLLRDEDDGPMEASAVHFGLEADERDSLFENKGCGNARTIEAAADFIEAFVARKFPEPKP